MRILGVLAGLALIAGCATTQSVDYDRPAAPGMFQALDTQPDGFEGLTADGRFEYEIVSTLTDGERLCRVVNLEGEERFHTESFCRVRGGEWR